ncbi:type II secretion system F family protein [Streptomyces sp. NPDC059063]|uniref:type II secretion system F family protein n=1 Tax=unclassified Streptomyces TaxID=2593676 RepID=UPI0036D08FF7
MSGAEVFHRLGVTLWAAVAVVWLLMKLAVARRERGARRRVLVALGGTAGSDAGRLRGSWSLWGAGARKAWWRGLWGDVSSGRRDAVWRGVTVAGAVGAGWALIGGITGLAVGAGVGCVVGRIRRDDGRKAELDAAEAARQLPLAADLLAACVAAGAGPVAAAQAVGESLRGPVGERLAWGAAQLRLGSEPAAAWRRLAEIPGAGALARHLERAGESGAPAAGPVARLAADCRAERGRAATARARKAAVSMTAPVGLCFLPAFIAVGVLPVVIGLASGLMSGGG